MRLAAPGGCRPQPELIFLDENAIEQADALIISAAHRHRIFRAMRSPGSVLRVSIIFAFRPTTAST